MYIQQNTFIFTKIYDESLTSTLLINIHLPFFATQIATLSQGRLLQGDTTDAHIWPRGHFFLWKPNRWL